MSECCCCRCGECDCKTSENELRNDLLEFLESRFAMRVIMWLHVRGECALNDVIREVSDHPGTNFATVVRGMELGLIACSDTRPQDLMTTDIRLTDIRLTDKGERVAQGLLGIFGVVE